MQADIINKICEPNKDNPIIQEAVGCLEFYDYQLKRIVNRKKCLKGEDVPDPDKDSKTLRLLHQVLWSKKISPKNEMILTQDLKWRDFSFGSDTIINGFIWPEKYEKKLQEFYEVKGESFFDDMREFTLYVYTIGGFLVFPTHGQSASINKRRGTDPEIQDRFDSTLECIQKFYLGQENPLSDILNVDKCFFDLFGYGEKGFRKYVDFFFLQDLVSKDYKTIQYFLPKEKGVLPQNFEDYYTYRHNCIEFIKKRNERIAQELKKFLMKKYKYSYKKHDFNILKNQQGHLMLLLRSFEGDIEKPQLNYDGKLTATLYRCPNNLVTLSLDGAPLSMCQDLIQRKKILVCETNKDKITLTYWATVKQT